MSHPKIHMTGTQFCQWAATMVAEGIVEKEADLHVMLGITRQGFWLMKGRGCDLRTALACSAIASKMAPWAKSEETKETKQLS